MPRPAANYWNNAAAPPLIPGMNDRETAIMDYAEELARQVTVNAQTASYTPVLADAGKLVTVSTAGAGTFTVPPNSGGGSVAFPVGTAITLMRYGAGSLTVVAGAGVTLRSSGGLLAVGSQYGVATLIKLATNEWLVFGDLL